MHLVNSKHNFNSIFSVEILLEIKAFVMFLTYRIDSTIVYEFQQSEKSQIMYIRKYLHIFFMKNNVTF